MKIMETLSSRNNFSINSISFLMCDCMKIIKGVFIRDNFKRGKNYRRFLNTFTTIPFKEIFCNFF